MRNDDGHSPDGEGWENSGFPANGDSGGLRPGSFGDRINSILRERQSLPMLEEIRSAQQPHVPNGHWETIAEAVTGASSNELRNRTIIPVGAVTLEELINPALTVLKEVMEVPLNDTDPNFARILSTKKDAAVSVVNAALKADENRFRQPKSNILEELMARINAKEITVEVMA